MSSAAPRRRPLPLVAVDVVVGVAALLFGVVLGLVLLANYAAFGSIGDGCRCDTAPLTGYVIAGIAVTILAFALGLGFFVMREIQRRYGWYFPIVAVVVMIGAFWGITALIGAWARAVNP